MSRAGLIRMKGAAVTFTHTAPGSHDPEAGTFGAPTITTVKGYAMRSTGDLETYKALELIVAKSLTLDFTPRTAGEVPALDSKVTLAGADYTVRAVEPFGLNFSDNGARIVVST